MVVRRSAELLDTYLLKVFCLLVTERSVSRVALKLNQSQPTVSVALRRLRAILGDPLLVRERAAWCPPNARLACCRMPARARANRQHVAQPDAFEPFNTRQEFHIWLPRLLGPRVHEQCVRQGAA